MKILIVDDEEHIRELLGDYLTDVGYQVSSAQDGMEAWNLLGASEVSFDVVLCDLMMPRLNGWELLRKIKQQSLPIPVVLVTGQIDVEDKEASLAGAFGIIHKPFNLSEIMDLLKNLNSGALQSLEASHD